MTLNRSPLAGNDSSNFYIFMLIIVTHNMAITHIIHWEKNKTRRKIFSETNYMVQDSSKNRLALVKTNRVSKFMLSVQKLCC